MSRTTLLAPKIDDNGEADGGSMGFLEHLDELRTRIIRSAVALGVGMVVAFAFVDRIADVVLGPTIRTLPPGTELIGTRLTEGLAFYMDLALLGGLVLAAPFVTWQVWGFVAPGLYAREKRLIVPFVALATCGTVALLTPSPDPWNQAMFALPMLTLYLISIAIAWVVAPRPPEDDDGSGARNLKLVFAATVLHETSRADRAPAAYPRLWRGTR